MYNNSKWTVKCFQHLKPTCSFSSKFQYKPEDHEDQRYSFSLCMHCRPMIKNFSATISILLASMKCVKVSYMYEKQNVVTGL